MEFNINENVKVKLTDKGKDIYFHQYDDYPTINASYPKVDNNGYTRFQLWDLMKLYGSYMGLCKDLVFETTIILDNK